MGPARFRCATSQMQFYRRMTNIYLKFIVKNRFVVYHRVFRLAGLHGQDGRACAISGEVGNSQICLTRESCK